MNGREVDSREKKASELVQVKDASFGAIISTLSSSGKRLPLEASTSKPSSWGPDILRTIKDEKAQFRKVKLVKLGPFANGSPSPKSL